ncbi:MAG TPA: hypothetical protein GX521_03520 [Firmicutes bacterium]|nr:hypothetical protein [Bacillota bacterium]
MAISLEDLILEFLTELHGTAMRKGILKFEYEHPRDVVRYSFLETLDNPARIGRLRKLALLHDVVEEGCDLRAVASLFSLDQEESHLLALLSRNIPDAKGRE